MLAVCSFLPFSHIDALLVNPLPDDRIINMSYGGDRYGGNGGNGGGSGYGGGDGGEAGSYYQQGNRL